MSVFVSPDAIKKYMAARKRAWKAPPYRQFPYFMPGTTSTATYVRDYYRRNKLGTPNHIVASELPAPFHRDGETVIVETVE